VRLAELFEDRALPFDFKDEELPNFLDHETSRQVGTFDNQVIWGSRFYGRDYDAYGILNDGVCVAMVVITTSESIAIVDDKATPYQTIAKIWVHANFRGKAYATCIIGFLIKKMCINLSSGPSVTVAGEKFLRNIIKRKSFNMSALDVMTRVTVPIDPSIEERLFQIEKSSLQLLIHESHMLQPVDNKFAHPVLKEMCRFFGDVDIEWD
jgi:hypothetical protein